MSETYKIILNEWQITGGVIFCVSVLVLLHRIGSAIIDQNEWLKGTDEIDNIGN